MEEALFLDDMVVFIMLVLDFDKELKNKSIHYMEKLIYREISDSSFFLLRLSF